MESNEINELLPEADSHYWLPIPEPDGRRHAFRGARRWPGQASGKTVCGVEVAMARPSEMDWVYRPTCGFCWETLIDQQRSRETLPGAPTRTAEPANPRVPRRTR